MPVAVERVHAPTDDARTLVDELEAELSAQYPPENRHGYDIARLFRPNVAFYIARLDGNPVGCGGVACEDGFAELKRMYVRPGARGRGVARALLDRLEQDARARGVTRLTLETGDAQLAAIRFYERAGFTRCAAFGAYTSMPPESIRHSVFFEKCISCCPCSTRDEVP
jgi:putative acetyltransferase